MVAGHTGRQGRLLLGPVERSSQQQPAAWHDPGRKKMGVGVGEGEENVVCSL